MTFGDMFIRRLPPPDSKLLLNFQHRRQCFCSFSNINLVIDFFGCDMNHIFDVLSSSSKN